MKRQVRLARFILLVGVLGNFGCGAGKASAVGAPLEKREKKSARPPDRESFFRDVVIQDGEAVGDLSCFFCSVVVRGTVEGDAVAIWGSIDVEGKVKSDAVAIGGSIHLGPASNVSTDAVAIGGRVARDAGSTVGGNTIAFPYLFFPGQRQILPAGLLAFFAIHLCFVLLANGILRARRVENVGRALRERPFWTLVAGLLAALAVIGGLFALDLHGWLDDVVSIGLPALLLVIAVPGFVGISLLVGRRIRFASSALRGALLGAGILIAFSAVPLLGLVVYTMLVILAVGAALVSRFGAAPTNPLAEGGVAGVTPPH